jgi:hypothetical protein
MASGMFLTFWSVGCCFLTFCFSQSIMSEIPIKLFKYSLTKILSKILPMKTRTEHTQELLLSNYRYCAKNWCWI